MKKEIFQTLKIVALSLIFSASFAFATWVAMPTPPPSSTNNANNPINVSVTNQVKIGPLSIGPLAVFGPSQMNGAVNVLGLTSGTTSNLYVTGNIGIGVNPPSQKVDVNGNIKISSLAHSTVASAVQVCADTTGKIVACGNKCGSSQGITGSKPTTNLCSVGTPHSYYSGYQGCTPGVFDASCPDDHLPKQGNTVSPNDTNQWLWTCEGAGVPLKCNSFRPI